MTRRDYKHADWFSIVVFGVIAGVFLVLFLVGPFWL